MNDQKQTQALVFIALMTSLVAAVTAIIVIPIGQGYLNIGDLMVMIAAVIMPVQGSIFAASIGSAMADILSGYAQYAVFTFFIKGIEAYIVYKTRGLHRSKFRVVSFFSASFVMILMYGVVDAFLASEIQYFWFSLVDNLPQALISAGLMTIFYPKVIDVAKKLRIIDEEK